MQSNTPTHSCLLPWSLSFWINLVSKRLNERTSVVCLSLTNLNIYIYINRIRVHSFHLMDFFLPTHPLIITDSLTNSVACLIATFLRKDQTNLNFVDQPASQLVSLKVGPAFLSVCLSYSRLPFGIYLVELGRLG